MADFSNYRAGERLIIRDIEKSKNSILKHFPNVANFSCSLQNYTNNFL